jgi:hypothetical protein
MNVDLKILHLQRALWYIPIERPAGTDVTTLEGLASQFGECLLVFAEGGFSTMTDDGPKLLGAPDALPIESAYHAAAAHGEPYDEEAGALSLAPGDYVFYQWRAHREPKGQEQTLGFAEMLEEVVREAWWQGLECSGPWYVRLVTEDGSTAMQTFRRLNSVP